MTRRHGNATRRAYLDDQGQEEINDQLDELIDPQDPRSIDELAAELETVEQETATEAA